MFRFASVVAGVVLAVLVGALSVPATAESVLVHDSDPHHVAAFLAIDSARFTNGAGRLSVVAVHPGLVRRKIDEIRLEILVGRALAPRDRTVFVVIWRHSGTFLQRTRPGESFLSSVRCAGLHSVVAPRLHVVRLSVPRSCLVRSRSVRMGYSIENLGLGASDEAPATLTWWLRRG